MNITIGTDGEFFLEKQGVIIPSQHVLTELYGSKEDPIILENGAFHRDNVLGEFAHPPAANADEFVHHIRTVLAEIQEKFLNDFDCTALFIPSHNMAWEFLEHPEATVFGCDPELNAYTGEYFPSPDVEEAGQFRSAGGHLHAGWDFKSDREKMLAAIAADIFVGLPAVLLDKQGLERKSRLYGKAGACRIKPYGIEYRTLSNFWYQSDELIRWAFNSMTTAVENRNNITDYLTDGDAVQRLQHTINTGDVNEAKILMAEWDIQEIA